MASVNTHDMPTFAGWLAGDDVRDRLASGLVDDSGARQEARTRRETVERLSLRLCGRDQADASRLLEALLRELGGSPASVVIASLEDMWLELAPQNVPGTGAERLNWRRRARLQVDDVETDPRVARVLDALSTSRRGPPHG